MLWFNRQFYSQHGTISFIKRSFILNYLLHFYSAFSSNSQVFSAILVALSSSDLPLSSIISIRWLHQSKVLPLQPCTATIDPLISRCLHWSKAMAPTIPAPPRSSPSKLPCVARTSYCSSHALTRCCLSSHADTFFEHGVPHVIHSSCNDNPSARSASP